jgi:hypothetical protein
VRHEKLVELARRKKVQLDPVPLAIVNWFSSFLSLHSFERESPFYMNHTPTLEGMLPDPTLVMEQGGKAQDPEKPLDQAGDIGDPL